MFSLLLLASLIYTPISNHEDTYSHSNSFVCYTGDTPPSPKKDIVKPSLFIKQENYIMPTRGVITSGYGWRWGRLHQGIDIANGIDTPIYASKSGKVIWTGNNGNGYGNYIIIRHQGGEKTLYAHLDTIKVKIGQQVKQEELIATMGSTGYATGPHLHFEIHKSINGNTIAIDPMNVLATYQTSLK